MEKETTVVAKWTLRLRPLRWFQPGAWRPGAAGLLLHPRRRRLRQPGGCGSPGGRNREVRKQEGEVNTRWILVVLFLRVPILGFFSLRGSQKENRHFAAPSLKQTHTHTCSSLGLGSLESQLVSSAQMPPSAQGLPVCLGYGSCQLP